MAVEQASISLEPVLLKIILRNALARKVRGVLFRSDGVVMHRHLDESMGEAMRLPPSRIDPMRALLCGSLGRHILRIDLGRGGTDQEMREFSISWWPSPDSRVGIILEPVQR